MNIFTIPLSPVWLIASAALPLKATALTYQFSGTFGTQFGGPLNNGVFSGWFSTSTPLAITQANTGTSYILFSSFDVQMQKGTTTVEFARGLNGSVGLLSAVYETANGGDFLQFYDNRNDNLTLCFASGFNVVGTILTGTSKGYLSDGGVGGYAGAQSSDVTGGSPSAPEPGSVGLIGAGALLCLLGRRRCTTYRAQSLGLTACLAKIWRPHLLYR